jgi:gamma-glutamyl:cysteine ligase YbdK (ATP-grasp superfamily)
MSREPPPTPGRVHASSLHAFRGYGIELEYMIVDKHDLSVKPVSDQLLRSAARNDDYEVERGLLGWSNELVLHVIEVKNLRPISSLSMLPQLFQVEVKTINEMLEPFGAQLMPTAMHPWMDPRTETRLWPYHNEAIYNTYDRIFDSKGHGWANLQSMHINLPFADDREFARLHAAVRLVLPILPALAASSPIAEQCNTGCMDYRMQVYRGNSEKVPAITGDVVPENVSSRGEYEEKILAPMYRDIAAFDPEGILRHEWLNSRGAIARFDRNAVEIRVIDTQECPIADLAIAAATSFVIRRLYHRAASELAAQQAISTQALATLLRACICDAEQTIIDDAAYLALLGYPGRRCSAHELWAHVIEQMAQEESEHSPLWKEPLQIILNRGPLARRILRAVGSNYSRGRLERVYREMCECLQEGRMFGGTL